MAGHVVVGVAPEGAAVVAIDVENNSATIHGATLDPHPEGVLAMLEGAGLGAADVSCFVGVGLNTCAGRKVRKPRTAASVQHQLTVIAEALLNGRLRGADTLRAWPARPIRWALCGAQWALKLEGR